MDNIRSDHVICQIEKRQIAVILFFALLLALLFIGIGYRNMIQLDNDGHGISKNISRTDQNPRFIGMNTLIGNDVYNLQDEGLGSIEEIALDIKTGEVNYAFLSLNGFIGTGDQLFAVPWSALELDYSNKRFLLDVEKKTLEPAPVFDKGFPTDMAFPLWQDTLHF